VKKKFKRTPDADGMWAVQWPHGDAERVEVKMIDGHPFWTRETSKFWWNASFPEGSKWVGPLDPPEVPA